MGTETYIIDLLKLYSWVIKSLSVLLKLSYVKTSVMDVSASTVDTIISGDIHRWSFVAYSLDRQTGAIEHVSTVEAEKFVTYTTTDHGLICQEIKF